MGPIQPGRCQVIKGPSVAGGTGAARASASQGSFRALCPPVQIIPAHTARPPRTWPPSSEGVVAGETTSAAEGVLANGSVPHSTPVCSGICLMKKPFSLSVWPERLKLY